MPAGRPSKYSPELAKEICIRIAEGESLRQICRDDDMPEKKAVLHWLRKHEEFRAQYALASEDQADHYAEEILEISDDGSNDWMERETKKGRIERVVDHENINRSRLRVDARKWLMSKLAPKKYGEKLQQEVTGKDGAGIEIVVNIAEKQK